jgi:hypothetical protein
VLRDLRRGAFLGAAIVLMLVTWDSGWLAACFGIVAAAIVLDRLLAARLGHEGRHMKAIHGALPVLSAVLIVLVAAQFAMRGRVFPEAAGASASAMPGSRDIWIVLLDGYPRADVLEAVYGRAPGHFLDGLADLGFRVSARSRSNYLETAETVPSLLDMEHVSALPASREGRWDALQDNRAFSLLREHGYEIVALGSGYTHVDLVSADRFIDAGTADLNEIRLLGATGLRYLIDTVAPTWATGQMRTRVEANLQSIGVLASEDTEGPRFVWAHIPAPHPPAVFGPDGSTPARSLEGLFFEDTHEGYLASLEHLEGLVLAALGELMLATGGEDVVIVMSDHGSRSTGELPATLTPEEANERFASFFAAYTPDHPGLFPDTITPVNVMAILSNAYLGGSIPLQPDTLFDKDLNPVPNPDRFDQASAPLR